MLREYPRALEPEKRSDKFCVCGVDSVREDFMEVTSQLDKDLPGGEKGKVFRLLAKVFSRSGEAFVGSWDRVASISLKRPEHRELVYCVNFISL